MKSVAYGIHRDSSWRPPPGSGHGSETPWRGGSGGQGEKPYPPEALLLVAELCLIRRERHGRLAGRCASFYRYRLRGRSRLGPVFLRHGDRFELSDDLVALILVPRRQVQLGPELLGRFVLIEAAGNVRRALDQDAAWRARVHRVEVEAILDLGAVGESEL